MPDANGKPTKDELITVLQRLGFADQETIDAIWNIVVHESTPPDE